MLKIDSAKMIPRNATGTSAVQKLEARRLQALTKQREKLEAEVRALEEEVLQSVRYGALLTIIHLLIAT